MTYKGHLSAYMNNKEFQNRLQEDDYLAKTALICF